MAKAAPKPPPASKKSPLSPEDPLQAPQGESGLDIFLGFFSRFNRYWDEILGVVLIAFALITLLALSGVTRGVLLTPWVWFLRRWLGYGSFFAVVPLAVAGLLVFRKGRGLQDSFPLGKILALEGIAFVALTFAAIVGGTSLDRAEAGLDGGIIGWGLAELLQVLLGPALRIVVLILIFLALLLTAVDWMKLIERRLQDAGGMYARGNAPEPLQTSGQETASEEESGKEPGKPNKLTQKLPPEYRKAFKVPPVQDALPAAPRPRDERLPPLNLLMGEQSSRPDERHINQVAGLLEKTLAEFGIPARVVGFRIGPTVTQFAVEPGFVEKPVADGETQRQKVRVSQISALSKDLALALSAERLRIEAPVPGRSYVGIEVPNVRSSLVRLRPLLESEAFARVNSPLGIALGRDVSGAPVVADLSRMPHLLIAGTTGSGKSVCIAAITACLVMNNAPEDLRLVMIDPKMVELVRFNGLPHMYGKVETDLERILAVLRWVMAEMDQRYRLLEEAKARDLEAYNRKMERRKLPTLPRLVVLIDELADLMMSAPDQTEHSLVRLAQLARATGIHLVVATQRPSTDVVTGLIKANFPARISFTVASSVDSRVILDSTGAETLLGRGDMLYLSPESGAPQRTQGVWVTDSEVEKIIAFWQKMSPAAEGLPPAAPWESMMNEEEDQNDELIQQAISVVRQAQRASASMLQRRLRIGYPRAARLIDELEELGIVGPSQGGGRERDVLVERDEAEEDA